MRYLACFLLTFLGYSAVAQQSNVAEQRTVKSVVYEFIKASTGQNYDFAKKLSTPGSHKWIDEIKTFDETKKTDVQQAEVKAQIEKHRKEILEASITYTTVIFDDDKCTVGFTLSNAPTITESLELRKINNTWLVDLEAMHQLNNVETTEVQEESLIKISEYDRNMIASQAKETATKFFKVLIAEKYDEAKKLSTKKSEAMVDMMKVASSLVPDSLLAEMNKQRGLAKNARIAFKNFVIESNTRCKIDFTSSVRPGETETVHLKKENGIWLVDLLPEEDIEREDGSQEEDEVKEFLKNNSKE